MDPLGVQAIATLEPEVILFDISKVASPNILKCSQVSKAETSSSVLESVTFLMCQKPRLPLLSLYRLLLRGSRMTRSQDFIHLVDADRFVGEGNQQCRRDAVLSAMRVSFLLFFWIWFSSFDDSLLDLPLCRYTILSKITMTWWIAGWPKKRRRRIWHHAWRR